MNQTYMKEKPILGLLLSMSLPMVVSMAVNSLYNIIDSLFIAKISEDAITALSLVYPMQNLVNAVSIGFGIGINAVVSFELGAQNSKKADLATSVGFLLSLAHGLFFTFFCIATIRPFLQLFSQNAEVVSLGVRYARIVFGFSVINCLALCFEKVFQAVGRMSVSMFAMMAGCISNIILDPILIFGLGLGIEGAAIATGLGQAIALVIYVLVYRLRPIPAKIRKDLLGPNGNMAARLYAIGIPACLNLALSSVLIAVLNAILSAYSQVYVLVLGVYYKLQTFLYLPANGVIQGMRPLIGYNYGAGEAVRVKKILAHTLALILVIMAVGTALCQLFPTWLIGLFTENTDTVAVGVAALRIISCGFFISAFSVTCSGALEGLSMGLPSLVICLCRYVLVLLPLAAVAVAVGGAGAVWHAFWVTEVVAVAVAVVLMKRIGLFRH